MALQFPNPKPVSSQLSANPDTPQASLVPLFLLGLKIVKIGTFATIPILPILCIFGIIGITVPPRLARRV
jgi:hypothetical protein